MLLVRPSGRAGWKEQTNLLEGEPEGHPGKNTITRGWKTSYFTYTFESHSKELLSFGASWVSIKPLRDFIPGLVLSPIAWGICKTVSRLVKVRSFPPRRSLNTTLFRPHSTRTCNSAKYREAAELSVPTSLRRFM